MCRLRGVRLHFLCRLKMMGEEDEQENVRCIRLLVNLLNYQYVLKKISKAGVC